MKGLAYTIKPKLFLMPAKNPQVLVLGLRKFKIVKKYHLQKSLNTLIRLQNTLLSFHQVSREMMSTTYFLLILKRRLLLTIIYSSLTKKKWGK